MRRPSSSYALPVITVCVFLVGARTATEAQISSGQVRDRYEQNTRGKDVDDFTEKLRSVDENERLEAAKSLASSKDPKAIPPLIEALSDPDLRVKAKAIDALGDLRAQDATPVLVQQLFLRENDSGVKKRILAALGKIGDPRAAGSILELLRRDLEPDVRGTALFALGEIGSPDALPTLQSVSEGDPDPNMRRLAQQAIAKVHHHQNVLATEAKEPQSTFLRSEKQPPAP